MRNSWILPALLCCLSATAAAEVYRWTDENGRTHFGDKPRGGAEEIKLEVRTVNTVTLEYLEEWKYKGEPARAPRGLVMYSTSWCGYCKKARRYFRSEGIAFTEKDIEESAAAKKEYQRLGGNGGVPFLVKGRQTMHGFSVSGFKALLKRAGG